MAGRIFRLTLVFAGFAAASEASAQVYNTTLVETPNGRVFTTVPAGAAPAVAPAYDPTWYALAAAGGGPPLAALPPSYYGSPATAFPSSAPALPAAKDVRTSLEEELRARILVRVPRGAEVWIGDQKMNQTGAVRRFLSPTLEPGVDYLYRLRARWSQDGKAVTREYPVMTRGFGRERDFFVGPGNECRWQ